MAWTRIVAGIAGLTLAAALGAAPAAAQPAACNHSAAAPVALGPGAPEHTLLLFWAGADCNAAVAGRAVLDAGGNAIYLFIEDPNRIRIKEPGIPPHPADFVPALAEQLAQEIEGMATTRDLPPYATDGAGGLYPMVERSDWDRARAAEAPMMCHSTGYSVSACFWLDPASRAFVMLYESGA